MLKDEAEKYIKSELQYGDNRKLYHYNCAETQLCACNQYYNLQLDPKTLKAIIPFGGGLYCEKVCGSLTGGIAALGVMYAEDKPSLNQRLKEITKIWVDQFEKEFGNINCADIKISHRDEKEGCAPVMMRAAELLEEIISESDKL